MSKKAFDAWSGTRSEYLATMMDRYKPPFHGDHILMLDADVIPIRRFDELFTQDALHGVQAHHSPYGADGWRALFNLCKLPAPIMDREYSGFGAMFNDETQRYGPPYFNSGMVFGPRHLFEKLSEPYFEIISDLRGYMSDTYWFDQLGLALAIAKAEIPIVNLPLRYNFPNRPSFDRANAHELANVQFLHAMQTDIVHRDRDFETVAAMHRLVARTDLTGSNEVLRREVGALLPVAFPEPAYWNGEERNFA